MGHLVLTGSYVEPVRMIKDGILKEKENANNANKRQ